MFWSEVLTLMLFQIGCRLSLLIILQVKNYLCLCIDHGVVQYIYQPSGAVRACEEQWKKVSAMQEQSKEGSRAPEVCVCALTTGYSALAVQGSPVSPVPLGAAGVGAQHTLL